VRRCGTSSSLPKNGEASRDVVELAKQRLDFGAQLGAEVSQCKVVRAPFEQR